LRYSCNDAKRDWNCVQTTEAISKNEVNHIIIVMTTFSRQNLLSSCIISPSLLCLLNFKETKTVFCLLFDRKFDRWLQCYCRLLNFREYKWRHGDIHSHNTSITYGIKLKTKIPNQWSNNTFQ